jgi:ADP-dependent phosphofructokinase/glucokinase
MLTTKIAGGISGTQRIDESIAVIKKWKNRYREAILHFEFASTQDIAIRKYLVDHLCRIADSIGCNERELIDVLEVIGEKDLAESCHIKPNSINLFRGLLALFRHTGCPRIQLHLFGLYITICTKNHYITPLDNRAGMILASIIAAAKAGTGSIDKNNLLWAYGKEVSDNSLEELTSLADFLREEYEAKDFVYSGIYEGNDFDITATPAILIDNPLTLVGMGDTISSLSLIGAKAK